MATKKQLIKFIEQNTGETESWGDLKSKNKNELEQIFDYLKKVKEQGEEKEGEVDNNEDSIIDGIDSLPEEEVKEVDPNIAQEYMVHKKPSELSISEQRLYAKTGFLPKIKVNKYTRFDGENIKLGF